MVLGGGFLGARIAWHLSNSDFQVTVLTRSVPRPELAHFFDSCSVVVGDVNSMSTLASSIAETDHVVYAVGSSSPVESDLDPASDIEVVLPPVVRLLELLRLREGIGVTFLSSGGTVYGNVTDLPAREESAPQPVSSYGILKLTAERYLRLYSDLHGVPVRILRIANAYGEGQVWSKGQGIIPRLMHCAMSGDVVPVYGDGCNIRDYVYVDDIARVVTHLIFTCDSHPLLNVGSGVGSSVLDLVELIQGLSGRRIDVQYQKQRGFDVKSNVLDISLLRNAIDFEPVPLRLGMELMWRNLHHVRKDAAPRFVLPHSPGSIR